MPQRRTHFLVLPLIVAACFYLWSRSLTEPKPDVRRKTLDAGVTEWVLHSKSGYLYTVAAVKPSVFMFAPQPCGAQAIYISADFFALQYQKTREAKERLAAADQKYKDAYVLADFCGGGIVTSGQESLKGLDLENAYFVGARLPGVNFVDTTLPGASFDGAVLAGAHFLRVDGQPVLRDPQYGGTDFVSFSAADLSGADLSNSKFANAQFFGARLDHATLELSDFDGAWFGEASLRDASLLNDSIDKARFDGADVRGLVYEPLSGGLPNVLSLARARNLDWITYKDNPLPLLELREQFRSAGLRDAFLAITAALNRKQNRDLLLSDSPVDKVKGAVGYLIYELPTDWGYKPSRALLAIFWLYLLCVPVYMVAILKRFRYSGFGFWKEPAPEDRRPFSPERISRSSLLRALPTALYISLLSAFNIGWRGLEIRGWISKLQHEMYVIEPRGWPRTISGIQALFTAAMVIVWLFTSFGSPFAA